MALGFTIFIVFALVDSFWELAQNLVQQMFLPIALTMISFLYCSDMLILSKLDFTTLENLWNKLPEVGSKLKAPPHCQKSHSHHRKGYGQTGWQS